MPGKGKHPSEDSSQSGLSKRQKKELAAEKRKKEDEGREFLNDFPIQPSSCPAFVKAWLTDNGGKTLEAYNSLATQLKYIAEQIQDPNSGLNLDQWRTKKIEALRSDAEYNKIDAKELTKKEEQVRSKVRNWRRDIIKEMRKCISEIETLQGARKIITVFEEAINLLYSAPNSTEYFTPFPFKFASTYAKEHFKGDYTLEAYASFAEKMREEFKDSEAKFQSWKDDEKLAQRKALDKKMEQQSISDAEKEEEDVKIVNRILARVHDWRESMTKEIEKCLTHVKTMGESEGNRDKANKIATALQEVLKLISAESRSTASEHFPIEAPSDLVKRHLGKGRTLENYKSLAKELKTYHGWFIDSYFKFYDWKVNVTRSEMNKKKLSARERRNLRMRLGAMVTMWPKLMDRELRRCEIELSKDNSSPEMTEEFKRLRELFFELDDNHNKPQKLLQIVDARSQSIKKGKEAAKYPLRAKKFAVYCFVNEFQRCERKLDEILKANSTTEADKNTIKKLQEEYKKLVTDGEEKPTRPEDSEVTDLVLNDIYLHDDDYSDFAVDEAQLIDDFVLADFITSDE